MTIARFRSVGLVLVLLSGCTTRTAYYAEIREERISRAQPPAASAEPAADERPALSGTLILSDAIQLALRQNKDLLAAVEEKEIAAGKIQASYGQVLPTVALQATGARADTGSVGGAPDPDPFERYSAGLRLVQPVFRGGAIQAALRAARLYDFWSDEFIRNQTQLLIQKTASAFYAVLLAERLESAARAAVESADTQLRNTQDRAAQGVAARYDVLRAEVELANARAELIQAQNRVRLARLSLFQLMGVREDAPVTLAGELRLTPGRPTLETLLRKAWEHRPDLNQADLLVRLQQESVRAAKGNRFPMISAFAQRNEVRLDHDRPGSGEWTPDWSVGLQVDWVLFDGLTREGRIAEEEAILRRRRRERESAEEKVWLELSQGLASLEHAERVVETQTVNLQRAREALALADAGYREGVTTAAELAQARAALLKTEALYAEALYSHTVARLGLRRAVGTLSPMDADPADLSDLLEKEETP